jgi:hypothetical protein
MESLNNYKVRQHNPGDYYYFASCNVSIIPIPKVASTTIRESGEYELRNIYRDGLVLGSRLICFVRPIFDRFVSGLKESFVRSHIDALHVSSLFSGLSTKKDIIDRVMEILDDEFYEIHLFPLDFWLSPFADKEIEIFMMSDVNIILQELALEGSILNMASAKKIRYNYSINTILRRLISLDRPILIGKRINVSDLVPFKNRILGFYTMDKKYFDGF